MMATKNTKSAKPGFPFFALLVLFVAINGSATGAGSESLAERSLRKIADRQKEIFAEAAKQGDNVEESAVKRQLETLVHDYELLLQNNPKYAEGYAAYGILLSKVDMRKEAAAMLLKANQLDPDMAIVKNQIGNLLAEDGKPLQAAPYFLRSEEHTSELQSPDHLVC